MKISTSRFNVKEIIFDDGFFAIAEGDWKTDAGIWEYSTACRWYAADGIGYPQTYGKPQWMVLPTKLGELIIAALLLGSKKKVDTRKSAEYLRGMCYQLNLNM